MIKIKQDKYILNSIFFLIFIISFNNSPSKSLNLVGAFSILLLLSSCLIIFLFTMNKVKINNYNRYFILFSFILVLTYMIGIVNYPSINSILTTAKIFLLLIFCYTLSELDFEGDNYNKTLNFGLVVYLIVYGYEIWIYGSNSHITGENTSSMIFVICIYFTILMYIKTKSIRYPIFSILFFVFVIYNRARTSLLAITVSLVIYFSWGLISKNKLLYRLFIILLFIMIFLFIYFYTYGDEIELFKKLNDYSHEYFNKNLFSGRNVIWKNLLEYVVKKPFLGYGSGIVSSDLYHKFGGSTHSFYMQVLIQVGWIGLIIWLLLFYSIWNMFWYSKNNKITQLSASFFVGVLVQNMLELTFYSNKISIGILQWFIIAIGLSRIKESSLNKNINKRES